MRDAMRLSRRGFMAWLGGGLALCAVPAQLRSGTAGELQTITASGQAMGAEVSITVLHADAQLAHAASQAALNEVKLVDELMSLYRETSEISRWNREGELKRPHPYMSEVIELALRISDLTDGAFDVTVQPLWRLYAKCKSEGRLPGEAELAEAKAKVGWNRIKTSDGGGFRFAEPGMAITLNGIAQGFAADKAVQALKARGIEHALVNAGEVAPLGSKAGGRSWTAGIQHPRRKDAYAAIVPLGERCLATSGDYATTFTDDRLHHHIFDPKTGRSPEELASASILAPTAAMADALATSAMVAGAQRGVVLLKRFVGVDGLFIRKDGSEVRTAGFPANATGDS